MSYELIETVEVGSGGASSIEFTSIPQDGTDLVVLVSGRDDSNTDLFVRLNSDTTGSNYSQVWLEGRGDSVQTNSSTSIAGFFIDQSSVSQTSNTFGNNSVYISNYTSSTDKSVSLDSVFENNATFAKARLNAGKYTTTSGITTVTLVPQNNFVQYSSASLYKITAA